MREGQLHVTGFGTGAESVIIAPYLSEFVARRYRGAFTGALAGFFSFGFVAAAVLGYLIVPAYAEGWRIVTDRHRWGRYRYRVDAEEAALRLAERARLDGKEIEVLVQEPGGELRRLVA